MTLPLVWMEQSFRRRNLKVVAHPGWQTRGRPYTFEPRAVIFHHTASNRNAGPVPALGTVINGRPDLPGPLCHILIGRDSKVHIIAAGYANHGGYGGPWGTIPKDSANRYSVGIEVENDGLGEPWPDEQLDTVAKVAAVLLHRFGKKRAFYCIGHKEWTTRKIDPARIRMWRFRRERVAPKLRAINEKARQR